MDTNTSEWVINIIDKDYKALLADTYARYGRDLTLIAMEDPGLTLAIFRIWFQTVPLDSTDINTQEGVLVSDSMDGEVATRAAILHSLSRLWPGYDRAEVQIYVSRRHWSSFMRRRPAFHPRELAFSFVVDRAAITD